MAGAVGAGRELVLDGRAGDERRDGRGSRRQREAAALQDEAGGQAMEDGVVELAALDVIEEVGHRLRVLSVVELDIHIAHRRVDAQDRVRCVRVGEIRRQIEDLIGRSGADANVGERRGAGDRGVIQGHEGCRGLILIAGVVGDAHGEVVDPVGRPNGECLGEAEIAVGVGGGGHRRGPGRSRYQVNVSVRRCGAQNRHARRNRPAVLAWIGGCIQMHRGHRRASPIAT